MKLHTLKRSKGIVSKGKRLGRGNGSGKGNYSGKGLKGQKARSGHSMKPFFEGGQTSIVQRIPKAKGFKRYFKLIKEYEIINLGFLEIDDRITDGMEISKAILKKLGYIKHADALVKVLGNGDRSKKVTFLDIDSFSKSANEKIANPGKKSDKPTTRTVVKSDKPVKKAPAKKAEKAEKPVKKVEAKAEKAEKPVKKVEAKAEKAEKPAKKVEAKAEKAEKPAKKTVAKKEPTEKKAVKKPAKKA